MPRNVKRRNWHGACRLFNFKLELKVPKNASVPMAAIPKSSKAEDEPSRQNKAGKAWFPSGWISVSIVMLPFAVGGADSAFRITSFDKSGVLTWANATVPGVCTVETSTTLSSNWTPAQNAFATSATGHLSVPVESANKFFRLRAVSVSNSTQGFTNLIQSYGLLETIAGTGVGRNDGVSYWQSSFEGGAATAASLSRPHYAMADKAGNIYIADKGSHSVLRIAANGTIHTHAGNHIGGFNGEGPATATSLQLNFPNALWVRADGTVYVLDTDNGRVRRVTTNGVMSTLFLAKADGSALGGGRMLWVKDDESLAYFGASDKVRQWTPSGGLQTLSSGFTELGTFYVEPDGNLIVADRGAHRVYRVFPDGSRNSIAGNGSLTGGGDGSTALQTALPGARGVWPVPTGGYLFLLHDGCELWYMDSANIMHLLVAGAGGTTHAGDGKYFYDLSQLKISEGRSVSMDYAGNILICESDYGYIRRIRFQRMPP
jgi:sugar lactone lactonase YvrE